MKYGLDKLKSLFAYDPKRMWQGATPAHTLIWLICVRAEVFVYLYFAGNRTFLDTLHPLLDNAPNLFQDGQQGKRP